MLTGKKSKLCELCYQYQDMNKKSSRQEFNELFAKDFNLVESTEPDGTLEKFELKFIDFRLSNVCNLKCRICSHHFSSKWYEDAKALGMISDDRSTITIPVEDMEHLWRQITPLLPHLEKIHFAGGEPLVMEEHYRILDSFIQSGNREISISYNSNFSELTYKKYDVIAMWNRFKYVSIGASLDGMGARGEYMRKGLKWEKVEQNRRRMLAEAPHVRFLLTPTVSIMNVLHLPDFFRDWVEKGLMKPTEINIYLLFNPEYYSIVHLPQQLKEEVNRKYNNFLETYVKQFDADTQQFLRNQFNVVLNFMHSADAGFAAQQKDFISYNEKLDNLRNENFREVFPELDVLFQQQ